MPRPPSRHGLEKKYKPWRRGKSAASAASAASASASADSVGAGAGAGAAAPGGRPRPNKATTSTTGASRASLKNQLRSQRRFLSKLPPPPPDDDNQDGNDDEAEAASAAASAVRSAIESKIVELELQISGKAQTNKERKNAEKYHQVRFFDRQKLTRMERTVRRKLKEHAEDSDSDSDHRLQVELRSIALDKLYVANYPNDRKYIALYVNGTYQPTVEDGPTALKRRLVREFIEDEFKRVRRGDSEDNGGNKARNKSWLDLDEVEKALELKAAAGGKGKGGKGGDGARTVGDKDKAGGSKDARRKGAAQGGGGGVVPSSSTAAASTRPPKSGGGSEEAEGKGKGKKDAIGNASRVTKASDRPTRKRQMEEQMKDDKDDGKNDGGSGSGSGSDSDSESDSSSSSSSESSSSGSAAAGAAAARDDGIKKKPPSSHSHSHPSAAATKPTSAAVGTPRDKSQGSSDSDSDSSSSSSDSDSDDSSSSSSSSDSDSEDEGDKEEDKNGEKEAAVPSRRGGAVPEAARNGKNAVDMPEDDFFVLDDGDGGDGNGNGNGNGTGGGGAGEGEGDTFKRAKQYSVYGGDDGSNRRPNKSHGWATQNQRPGQYKRRRERR